MIKFGVGQPVRRKEDQRLVTGSGKYADDVRYDGQHYAVMVRSPYAHARIRKLETADASGMPGVVAILTAKELAEDKVGTLRCLAPMENIDGTPQATPPRQIMAADRVRFVGDMVAMVVATSVDAAQDAAEAVQVDYEMLPSVTDLASAMDSGQPEVWPEHVKNNTAFHWATGDKDKVDAAFASATSTHKVTIINNRVVANPMEPRSVLARWDTTTNRLTVHGSTQGSHFWKREIAKLLGMDREDIRIVTGDVGGGFGIKIFLYPEDAAVSWAARRLKCAVKWTCDRSELFLSDVHGRDHVSHLEAACDEKGVIVGLRCQTLANLGAYLSYFSPMVAASLGHPMLPGCYRMQAIHAEVFGVYTHSQPIDAYRGAGRPEAAYAIERMVDVCARELGMSQGEFRRRNFIRAEEMPFATPLEHTYDSGDFARNMDDAMSGSDWEGFEERRVEARTRGKLRGIGMASYIEICGRGGPESAQILFEKPEQITVLIGTQSNGQGHETAYAQLVAERLGVPFDSIHIEQGDTDRIATGAGTGGSRSIPVGGAALDAAAVVVLDKARKVAANAMETAEADLEFSEGVFTVAGTDRQMSLYDVAEAAKDPANLPEGAEPGLNSMETFKPDGGTYPNGSHICELEIDPETGMTELVNYVIVDDFGNILNPIMLEGQVHGGTVQGIGQALYERTVFDGDGQLLTGSFMDYCLPRATDIPPIDFSTNVVPCLNNPLGVKGAGEAGAIGACAAVINAICDALAPVGVRTVDMPATPEAVWTAINQAGKATAE